MNPNCPLYRMVASIADSDFKSLPEANHPHGKGEIEQGQDSSIEECDMGHRDSLS
jgi:hypothetical protein